MSGFTDGKSQPKTRFETGEAYILLTGCEESEESIPVIFVALPESEVRGCAKQNC